jgi:hypothetical protein
MAKLFSLAFKAILRGVMIVVLTLIILAFAPVVTHSSSPADWGYYLLNVFILLALLRAIWGVSAFVLKRRRSKKEAAKAHAAAMAEAEAKAKRRDDILAKWVNAPPNSGNK